MPPHGQPMEFHWVFFMCIPWASSMGNALGSTPWAFYGITLGVLMWNGMAFFYVQSIGHLPISMLWTCTGASHRGMPRKCLMGTSVGCHPMGSPWNSIGYSLCAFHGLLLWLLHWGPTSMGLSMELHWEFSWGMAWLSSMCMPLGICPYPCYGLALVLLIGACQGSA